MAEIKTTYHISIGEYEFFEVTEFGDYSKEREMELREQAVGKGLPAKEWNEALDLYLWRLEPLTGENFDGMSELQVKMIHEIDKSRNRSLYKDMVAEGEMEILNNMANEE
jgi:hypothetical protein